MFETRLEALAQRLNDARLVALVASDGMPVEVHQRDAELDVDILSAELLNQVKSIADNQGELAMGAVKQVSIMTGQHTLMLGGLAAGYYLLIVLRDVSSFGRARYELRRAPLDFDPDLE